MNTCQDCKYFGKENTSHFLQDFLDCSCLEDVCYHNQIHGYNAEILHYFLHKRHKIDATHCKGFIKMNEKDWAISQLQNENEKLKQIVEDLQKNLAKVSEQLTYELCLKEVLKLENEHLKKEVEYSIEERNDMDWYVNILEDSQSTNNQDKEFMYSNIL